MSDTITVSDETRAQMILAAINSTGDRTKYESDDVYNQTLRQAAVDFTLMLGDKSPMVKLVNNVAGARAFRTIILDVKKEESTKRGFVTMQSKPTKYSKDGIETARTERMDSAEGLAMGRRIRELKGHFVTIWIYMETPANGGNDVRMIASIRDEGVATEAEIAEMAKAS